MACLSSLLFAFSPLVWEYSVGAEVFALNNLLVACILFFTVKVGLARGDKELLLSAYAGSFFCGLALSNQHTSALFIFVLVPWVALELFKQEKLNVMVLLVLSANFVAGLSPYLYLLYSSSEVKEGSWGDMTTFEGFKRHVLREEYGTLKLAPRRPDDNSETPLRRLAIWFFDFTFQVTPVFSLLSLLGVALANFRPSSFQSKADKTEIENDTLMDGGNETSGAKPKRVLSKKSKKKKASGDDKLNLQPPTSAPHESKSLHLALSCTLAFYLLFWNFVLSNLPLWSPMAYAVHSRFWMQPNLLLCMYSGLGSMYVLKFAPKVPVRALSLLIVFGLLFLRYPHADRSDASFNSSYGKAILDSLPGNSLLLSHTDLDWNTVRYMRLCEGIKPNIVHLSAQLLPYPWFQRQVKAGLYGDVVFPKILPGVSTDRYSEGNKVLLERFFEANIEKFGTNMFVDMQAISDGDLQPGGVWRGFLMVPHGLVYRVKALPPGATNLLSFSETHPESKEQMNSIPMAALMVQPKYKHGSWEFAANSVLNDGIYQTSLYFLTLGLEVGRRLQDDPGNLIPYYLGTMKFSTAFLAKLVQTRIDVVREYRGGGADGGLMSFGGMGGGAGVGVKTEVDIPLSYPIRDLIKNAALSAIKYMEVCEVAHNLVVSGTVTGPEANILNQDYSVEEAKSFVKTCVLEYLKTAPDDDSTKPLFAKFYASRLGKQ